MFSRFLLENEEIAAIEAAGVHVLRTTSGHVWVPDSEVPLVRQTVTRTIRAYRQLTGFSNLNDNGWANLILPNLVAPLGLDGVWLEQRGGGRFSFGFPYGLSRGANLRRAIVVAPGLPGRLREIQQPARNEFSFRLDDREIRIPNEAGHAIWSGSIQGLHDLNAFDGSAKYMTDPNGTIVGAVTVNGGRPVFYFPFPITAAPFPEWNWYPARLVFLLAYRLLRLTTQGEEQAPPVVVNATEEDVRTLARAMATARYAVRDTLLREKRARYDQVVAELTRLNTEIARILNEQETLSVEIDGLRSMSANPQPQDDDVEICRRILGPQSLVERVEFLPDRTFRFRTKPLSLVRETSRNRTLDEPVPLGKFTVSVPPGAQPRFESDDPIRRNGYVTCHPHIHDGHACFGNIRNLVAQQLHDHDYFAIVQTVIGYLQGYNAGDINGREYFPPFRQRMIDRRNAAQANRNPRFETLLEVVPEPTTRILVPSFTAGASVMGTCPTGCPLIEQCQIVCRTPTQMTIVESGEVNSTVRMAAGQTCNIFPTSALTETGAPPAANEPEETPAEEAPAPAAPRPAAPREVPEWVRLAIAGELPEGVQYGTDGRLHTREETPQNNPILVQTVVDRLDDEGDDDEDEERVFMTLYERNAMFTRLLQLVPGYDTADDFDDEVEDLINELTTGAVLTGTPQELIDPVAIADQIYERVQGRITQETFENSLRRLLSLPVYTDPLDTICLLTRRQAEELMSILFRRHDLGTEGRSVVETGHLVRAEIMGILERNPEGANAGPRFDVVPRRMAEILHDAQHHLVNAWVVEHRLREQIGLPQRIDNEQTPEAEPVRGRTMNLIVLDEVGEAPDEITLNELVRPLTEEEQGQAIRVEDAVATFTADDLNEMLNRVFGRIEDELSRTPRTFPVPPEPADEAAPDWSCLVTFGA